VGLWAKFAIIQAAAEANTGFGYGLIAFLVVNSVIAFFYYLRVVWLMWMKDAPEGAPAVQPSFSLASIVLVLMLATVVLFVLPGLISSMTSVTSVLATP
jgi:NADH-quinone oxidoreductase subunit N